MLREHEAANASSVPVQPVPAVLIESAGGSLLIDGMAVHDGGVASAIDTIENLTGRGRVSLVVTPNVDQILNLQDDPAFRSIFHTAEVLLADGAPVVWLGRLLGASRLRRITGADLLPNLVTQLGPRGHRVAIVGGDTLNGVAAAARLSQANPGSTVEHISVPFVADVASPNLAPAVDSLRRFGPSVVFVCLGSPKQEKWVHAWRNELPPAVYVGAGAAADFASDAVRRAPVVVQRLGFEWAWRLAQEPRRLWKRYLIKGPRFAKMIYLTWKNHWFSKARKVGQ
jgi:N-acetylglucosaminyldiphosphoundecaprenol N-acetyl-beta-D-mannosaminyltransferase